MKKIFWILTLAFLFSCTQQPVDLYTGRLIKVEFNSSFNSNQWMLTFIDGQIWTIHKQPSMGFKLGAVYTIYENRDGWLRAKRKGY